MDPVIAIVLLIFVAIIAYFFGAARGGDAPEVVHQKNDEAEALRSELGSARSALSEEKNAHKKLEEELRSLRSDLKSAKQKAHEREQKWKDSEARLNDAERKLSTLSSVESSREEMLEAQARVANLEAELQRLRSRGESPAPAAPVAEVASGADLERLQRTESELSDQVSTLSARLKEQARELKTSFNEQVNKERDRYKGEIRDLQKRLRTALRDVDRERRRAEQNDRAYLVLKSQLEAALDRVAMHDPDLRRPDQLRPPAPQAEQAAAPTALSATPEGEVAVESNDASEA